MRRSSSLSEEQREAAVAWFEKGIADKATASLLGVARPPVDRLYRRWRIHGWGNPVVVGWVRTVRPLFPDPP